MEMKGTKVISMLLWISGPRVEAPGCSSAILMARLTPKQNP
jgi:hypothetical protein